MVLSFLQKLQLRFLISSNGTNWGKNFTRLTEIFRKFHLYPKFPMNMIIGKKSDLRKLSIRKTFGYCTFFIPRHQWSEKIKSYSLCGKWKHDSNGNLREINKDTSSGNGIIFDRSTSGLSVETSETVVSGNKIGMEFVRVRNQGELTFFPRLVVLV